MSTITLLGPQIREPNLAFAIAQLRLAGPFASISAGWQEREGEIDELGAHLHSPVADLRIYARTEDVFGADRTLRIAHRDRQGQLQEMQALYTLRLGHAKQAARELMERPSSAPRVLREARRAALTALRRLDHSHLRAIQRVHAEFERSLQPAQRPAVQQAVAQIEDQLDGIGTVLVAGGHVAALLNRLRLLGAQRWLAGRTIVAWSAGAMALAEAVVLFHDQPPQGSANAEVFDAGLGMYRGVIPLPHAQARLHLHDAPRVALLARRFAPSACLTLDAGACLHFVDGALERHTGAFQLARQGMLTEIAVRAPSPLLLPLPLRLPGSR